MENCYNYYIKLKFYVAKITVNKVKHKQEAGKSICNLYHKKKAKFPFYRVPTYYQEKYQQPNRKLDKDRNNSTQKRKYK